MPFGVCRLPRFPDAIKIWPKKHIKLIINYYQLFYFYILQNTGKLWKNSKMKMKWVKKQSSHDENFILYYMVNARFVLLFLMKQMDEKKINVQTLSVIEILPKYYLGRCQTSMMKFFTKIVKSFWPSTIFVKSSDKDL